MEIIILAGGVGSRLQKVVNDVPKCMANVAGKPFLYYLFSYLTPYDPSQVILSLGYKHEIVEDWLTTISHPFGITCKVEKEPLGTGGAIKYALSAVNEKNAIIINGDTFFDIDLFHFLDTHIQKQATVSLALKPMKNFERYGTVHIQPQTSQIIRFEEKKPCTKGLINGGMYVIEKNAMNEYPEKFSMENDFFSREIASGKLYGTTYDHYFIDIGVPDDYHQAQTDFKDGKIPHIIS